MTSFQTAGLRDSTPVPAGSRFTQAVIAFFECRSQASFERLRAVVQEQRG